MKKIKSSIFITLALLFAVIGIPNMSKATTLSPNLYFGIQETRAGSEPEANMAFAIGEPGHGNTVDTKTGSVLWKIVKHETESTQQFDASANIYCVKGDVGFSDEKEIQNYADAFDFVTEREAMKNATNHKNLQSLVKENANEKHPERDPYYGIIALSDLIYVKGSIAKDGTFVKNKTAEADKKVLLKNAKIPEAKFDLLSDDIIDAIQQAAFWYFTNHDSTIYEEMYARYDPNKELDEYNWFFYKSDTQDTYTAIMDCNPEHGRDTGEERAHYAYQLYNYLVKTTLENIPKYKDKSKVSKNKITLYTNIAEIENTQPVIVIEKVQTFDLALRKYITKIDDIELETVKRTRVPSIDKSTIETKNTATYNHRKDPEIVKTGSIVTYNISIYNEGDKAGYAKEIVDQLPTGLEYVQESQIDGFTATYERQTNCVTFKRNEGRSDKLEAYTGGELDFETLTFQCKVTQEASTSKDYVLTNVAWISKEYNAVDEQDITNIEGDDRDSEPQTVPPNVKKDTIENYTGNTSNNPDLTKSEEFYQGYQDDDDFEKVVVKSYNFDLALRKYITKVGDTELAKEEGKTRIPVIKTDSMTNTMTATYNHRKDPVEVQTGDTVTYDITVYNEGDRAGYAKEIVDQLPTGLKYKKLITNHGYTEDYNQGTNRVTFKRDAGTNLAAFTNRESLDSETITIECEVTQVPDAKNEIVLTNVAWISKEYNAQDNVEITEIKGQDRDSEPSNAPNVAQDSMAGYTGNTKNDKNLADANKFYQGNQDDDDFEKLVVKPKQFDLALRKYITKVGNTELSTEKEKTREPVIETDSISSTMTATYKHRKDPVVVQTGDLVTYNITVYNEGQNAGYATKIVDQLPTGLTYKNLITTTLGYSVDYQSDTNCVTLTRDTGTVLEAYTGGKLASETITIQCQVTQKPHWKDQMVLTNVAWIAEEYDAVRKKKITSVVGEDRDSEPENTPGVTLETITDYTGKEGNDTELSNPNEFYQGKQDDDDFEKLVVMPKKFDLALRKYITKVDDTDLAEQQLTRIPDIESSTIAKNGTATYRHRKNPVIVHKGSIVTYNITIYNEGEKAGYASQVIDQLPEGLKYNNITSGEFTANYDTNANRVTFTRKAGRQDSLPAYTAGNPSSETITFECEVTQPPLLNKEVVLTNVAWIAEEVNVEDNLTITKEQGQDRDSEPATDPGANKTNMENYQGNDKNPEDLTNANTFYEGKQDDDDFEKVKLLRNNFDLALRKYITQVGNTVLKDAQKTREPSIDPSTITETKTATYNHRKDPVEVEPGDSVIYDITIYNEGDRPGYATKIIDQLPEGLKFIKIVSSNGFIDDYQEATNQVIFTRKQDRSDVLEAYKTGIPASETITIECQVTQKPDENTPIVLTNVAWIAEEFNSQDNITIKDNEGEDRDSEPGNAPHVDKDTTKDHRGNTPEDQPLDHSDHFYPGNQDDDDFESVAVKPKKFDLRLKKSVYEVEGEQVPERIKNVNVDGLRQGTSNDATIEMNKEPVGVQKEDIVKYRLRIYNEGERDGYAEQISENIPEGLEFVQGPAGENATELETEAIQYNQKIWTVSQTNAQTQKVEMVTTNCLSRENGEVENLIKAFDKTKDYADSDTDKNPDYRDIYIYMKVISKDISGTVLRNEAAITEDADEDGEPVNDRDSNPKEWPGKEESHEYQDEEDYDEVILQDFDLALRKYITKVGDTVLTGTDKTRNPDIETNTIADTNTATYKHRKDPVEVQTGDIITYNLTIYNEGYNAGYATKIVDQLPEGLIYHATTTEGFTTSYDKDTNRITLERNTGREDSLAGYTTGELKSETITIECEVTQKPHWKDQVILTNVAWISEEYDAVRRKTITDVEGDDRDSEPATNPQVAKDTMEDYTGKEGNHDNLAEPEEFYQGEQDDDDFEKLVVMPKKFDLALRKYIIQVDDTVLEEQGLTRIPDIETSTIAETGTATYKHRKNPVIVHKGSIVTYNITVYNEGEKAGYATKIIDQLPEGLKYSKMVSEGYTAAYDEQENRVTFTRTTGRTDSLAAYTTGLPASETITFECEVTQKPILGDEIILTNVAWIAEEFNVEDDLTITNIQEQDRDSEPATAPEVDKTNMETYQGNDKNPEDLANENTFYEGKQDDDDFEKVKLMPNNFDLALRKYITKVGDTVLADEERTRVPDVDTNALPQDKTATYKHRKDPVEVEQGDRITYDITIYNEGDRPGYATKVVDQLPTGLKFIQIVKSNGFTASYEEDTNRVTFTRNQERVDNLPAYTTGKPASETITIECEVMQKPDEKEPIILTNVAWISEEFNSQDEITITNTEGDDRDSEPGTAPDVDKDTTKDHRGDTPDTEPLDQPEHFYPGEQDDDDFESVVVKPKHFDLRLKKSIYEVNGEVVPERINSIDVTALQEGTSTDATIKMNKEPVEVKKGDMVKYRLRVYNEGERDGYAEEISEDIPEGLEFIEGEIGENTTQEEKEAIEYNQKVWKVSERNIETQKVEMVTTDCLSKENGEVENLMKAFDKTKGYLDTEVEKNPDYRDIYVYMKVISDEVSGTIIRNEAAITEDADEDGEPVEDRDSKPEEWPGKEGKDYQDEEDYDNVVLQEFDLALRKFIIAVSNDETIEDSEYLKNEEGTYTREPQVDTSLLNTKGEDGKKITTATYTHSKEPLIVHPKDVIVYMLRIYNEGDIAGYASKITDYLPEGLEFVEGEFNQKYGWEYDEKTRTITTTYLQNTMIEAPTKNAEGTWELKYAEVPIMCQLNDTVKSNVVQTNIAEITEEKDKDKETIEDRDSTPHNLEEPSEPEKPTYEDNQQDDDDYEKVLVQSFDLALRKFITKVGEDEINTRIPQVSYDKEQDQITYQHSKEPVDVVIGEVVEYTIRVFNEGARDGYAAEVLDDIPDGLEFLPENNTNTEYRWVMYREVEEGERTTDKTVTHDGKTYVETQNASEADIIVTDYLSMEQGEARMGENETENPALLKAFDPSAELSDTNPDHADVVAAFKVVQPEPSDKTIVNHAQISKDTDDKGNDIEDDDSEPDQWNEGEDDQDEEAIKPKYFDLALRKWVTQSIVIENGKQTVTQTGHTPEQDPEPIVKVDLDRKKLNQVTVKFRYSIRITNEGDIAGYAKEVTDYVPEGLKFVAGDNPGWQDAGNNVIKTNLLADRLLQPGESADVEVVLTWINQQDNMGLKTNTAEISKDENDRGVPDRDSTPNNKKQREDDIDDAPVMLSIKTGKATTYIILGVTILTIFASGIVCIRKYVR